MTVVLIIEERFFMPDYVADCAFCKIIKEFEPGRFRFQDNDVVAFDDVNPKAAVHILIVPKKHIHSVAKLPNDGGVVAGKMIMAAKNLAKEFGIHKSGYRLVFNSGRDAGSEVDHIHLHLLGGGKLGGMV